MEKHDLKIIKRRNCLNCIWFNKDKIHCDFDFSTSRYKAGCLDDDNNFIDENNELIEDVNVLEDFRCHKYYERPPKTIKQVDLMEDYRNIVDKIKEHIKTELEKRYKDIEFVNDNSFLISCTIKDYLFELSLENKLIYISYFTEKDYIPKKDDSYIETFEELFKYIDDVISEANE